MMDMPSLVFPSILATILLSLFLAFWVAVVVCLATANYPGTKPILPHASSGVADLSEVANNPTLRYRNNSDIDYKSFNRIEYIDAHLLQNMLWVYFIGLIWTTEFIFGKHHFTHMFKSISLSLHVLIGRKVFVKYYLNLFQ